MYDMETTITTTETPVERVTRLVILAEEAVKEAERVLADAKDELVRVYEAHDVEKFSWNGKFVNAVKSCRRSFDISKLGTLIPSSVFQKVTKISVDTTAFDKARKRGEISEIVENDVSVKNHYVRIVVGTEASDKAEEKVA